MAEIVMTGSAGVELYKLVLAKMPLLGLAETKYYSFPRDSGQQ